MLQSAIVEDKEISDDKKESSDTKLDEVLKEDVKIDKNDLSDKISDDNFYTAYSGDSEEFYSADDTGVNYYDLLMKSDDKKETQLSSSELHEDKVEKKSGEVQSEAWRCGGGITFLMANGLTKYEHTDMVAASSVDGEERRIFSLMYPGWWKCLYDLGKVTIINN